MEYIPFCKLRASLAPLQPRIIIKYILNKFLILKLYWKVQAPQFVTPSRGMSHMSAIFNFDLQYKLLTLQNATFWPKLHLNWTSDCRDMNIVSEIPKYLSPILAFKGHYANYILIPRVHQKVVPFLMSNESPYFSHYNPLTFTILWKL